MIPAYNEESRIVPVLRTLTATPEVDEVIVVSDGSTDNTCQVAESVDGVTAIQLQRNVGKGGAMRAGAEKTDADILIFFDADLIGLTPQHVQDLLAPVCSGEVEMALGNLIGGRWATDIAQHYSPNITGQRAVVRSVFLQVPDIERMGYAIELAINYYVWHHDLRSKNVWLRGVTHPMREEKLGFIRGVPSRIKMYWQMLRFRISYELFGRPPKSRWRRRRK